MTGRDRATGALPSILAGALTGSADLALTGTLSVGTYAAPLVTLVATLGGEFVNRHWRRGAKVVEDAAEQVGGMDRFEALATADDERLALTEQVLQAAVRTTRQDKLCALARVLANGLDAGVTVDESRILTAALDAVEEPHVQVLSLIASATSAPDQPDPDMSGVAGWGWSDIRRRLPGYTRVLPAVSATLTQAGLALDVSSHTHGGLSMTEPRLLVTDLGTYSLEFLQSFR